MIEMSMYPLQDEFIAPIKGFIERLNSDTRFDVVTTPTSTRIVGEHFALMQFIADETHRAYQQVGQAIFVCKFLNADAMSTQQNNSKS